MFKSSAKSAPPLRVPTDRLEEAFRSARISRPVRLRARAALAALATKHVPTYEHCIRVGLLAAAIARYSRLDTKALLLSGVLHDVGKTLCPPEILGKTSGWSAKDARMMQRHVLDGYRILRGVFEFSAEVMLLHHRFQPDGYPKKLPRSSVPFSPATRARIFLYGRILALSDCFDALHRVNDKHGEKRAFSSREIKEKMFEYNPDSRDLLEKLYNARILK